MFWRVVGYFLKSVVIVSFASGLIGAGLGLLMQPREFLIVAVTLAMGMAVVCAPFYLIAIGAWAFFYPAEFSARFGPGKCAACGYDLTGIAPERCPECGHDLSVLKPGVPGRA